MSTGATVSLLVGMAISLLAGLMGVYMLVTGNPGLLHDYHRATTAPDALPKLARWSGLGLTVTGMGAALPVAHMAAASGGPLLGWAGSAAVLVLAIALFVAGMATTFASIVHYNGSLFS